MSAIRNVCVYCGSSAGADARFGEAAEALGRALAAEGVGLVYGGAGDGLMGRLARVDARRRRLCDRRDPELSHPQGTCADRRPRIDRRRGYARTQAADVRSRRRFRGAAGRGRHARGTGRADDLGAAQPPREADPDRQYRPASGARCSRSSPTCMSKASFAKASICAIWWPKESRTCCRCCAPPPNAARPTANLRTPSLLATCNGEAPQGATC